MAAILFRYRISKGLQNAISFTHQCVATIFFHFTDKTEHIYVQNTYVAAENKLLIFP